jgi:hypothetical protein
LTITTCAAAPHPSDARHLLKPGRLRCLPLLLGLAMGIAGCSQTGLSQQDLSLACELHKCDCASDASTFDPGKPLQWQQDGSAYCPKDYHLRMLDLPPSQKMTT